MTHELYSAATRVYISDVSVDRSIRGQGVGAALMAQVKTWARIHNASKLGWEVWHRNVEAKAFYEKLGASMTKRLFRTFWRLTQVVVTINSISTRWRFRPSQTTDLERLYDVWHTSVIATHDFLNPSHLNDICVQVKNDYLPPPFSLGGS